MSYDYYSFYMLRVQAAVEVELEVAKSKMQMCFSGAFCSRIVYYRLFSALIFGDDSFIYDFNDTAVHLY